MQKVLAFLERHVQWVGIALGAVYLLWMVWAYVLNNPTQVQLADGKVRVEGPKGKLEMEWHRSMQVEHDEKAKAVKITRPDDDRTKTCCEPSLRREGWKRFKSAARSSSAVDTGSARRCPPRPRDRVGS